MEQKGYYAIIPATVRYDKNISASAKLLYGEITALCNEKGFCWAGNQYFMELYNVGKGTVIRWLNELIEAGYIIKNIQFEEDGKTVLNRYLSLPNATTWLQKSNQGSTKNDTTPGCKNRTYNNTVVNITENRVSKKVSNEKNARAYERESYEEILTRLGFSEYLQKQIFKFIQFQQANKKVVTNEMLEQMMKKIKYAADLRIKNSLTYEEDFQNYISESIQQALDGQWFELKEPKNFKTAAELEAEAVEDLKNMWG